MNTVIMVGIYMIIGLASKDYKPLGMMIERVWNMNCQNGVSDESKLQTIKAYIALNVVQWDKYWKLWQQIIDEKEGVFWGTKDKVKALAMRIPNGQLDMKQFLWILFYVTWNVIRNNNYIPFIPSNMEDIDFIIDFAGLGFFTFTSGIVIGLGNFMEKIFESIKPSKVQNVVESLRLLEQNIIFGARHFGFLRDVVEMKCEDTNIEPDVCSVCKIEPKEAVVST